MLVSEFLKSLDFWISHLDQYEFKTLLLVPDKGKWSMGQLYMHLIDSTDYFLEQAEICLNTNRHAEETSSASAKKMFADNEFPDILIDGPPSNGLTSQPTDKLIIFNGLENLRLQIMGLEERTPAEWLSGKTRHPGLGWFSAREWVQFAEMHLRHHQRQKNRIDHFLKTVEQQP